jgi:hypothetical protein
MKRLAFVAVLLLSASPLFAAADLSLTASGNNSVIRAGLPFSVTFTVHNPGPDIARDVKISFTSGVPTPPCCSLGDVLSGVSPAFSVQFNAPPTAGTVTITGTVTSSTPDDNAANNTATVTLTVSTDPDISLGLRAPLRQDLMLPFTLDIFLSNFFSKSDAHNVDVTVDFRSDVVVSSLPAGCTSPTTGRIVCHADVVPAGQTAISPAFSIGLVAPQFYGDGTVVFTAVATESEHDFDPISNTKTFTMTLYKTFYVFSTANEGGGTLRQAILDSASQCQGAVCAIVFRIASPSSTAWKTIRITSPLPAITTPGLRVDGATQHGLLGGGNPDGPDIEISGLGNDAGDGVIVSGCGAEIANLAINGFPGNGISVVGTGSPDCTVTKATLHHLFVGTDPTGTTAHPNQRGIATAVPNGTFFTIGPTAIGPSIGIHDCVISGNLRSGIFDLSGRLNVSKNRIGAKAHADEPLPNGNAGVYVGPGGYGSDIGAIGFATFDPSLNSANVIAFNGQMGIAVAAGTGDVAIRHNRIWGNAGLGIDVGLDGPQSSATPVPVLTSAHYDPVAKQTVIEGDVSAAANATFSPRFDFYANDAPDPSGFGQGQRPLGSASGPGTTHFRMTVDGDLTGQFITATATRVFFVGFAKPAPDGVDQGFLTQTSEFSRPIEVR